MTEITSSITNVSHYIYDSNGLLTVKLNDSGYDRYYYDKNNNLIQTINDKNDNITNYYDKNNTIVKTIKSFVNTCTSYHYYNDDKLILTIEKNEFSRPLIKIIVYKYYDNDLIKTMKVIDATIIKKKYSALYKEITNNIEIENQLLISNILDLYNIVLDIKNRKCLKSVHNVFKNGILISNIKYHNKLFEHIVTSYNIHNNPIYKFTTSSNINTKNVISNIFEYFEYNENNLLIKSTWIGKQLSDPITILKEYEYDENNKLIKTIENIR